MTIHSSISDDLIEPFQPVFVASWSPAKLRRSALVVAAALVPLAIAVVAGPPLLQALALALTALLLVPAHGIGRRAADRSPVLSIDRLGVLDRRIRAEHIYWSDIETFCPVNLDHAKAVDAYLRQPRLSRSGLTPATRFGRSLQQGFGVPAITFNFLLLDRDVVDFAAAAAGLRPGLWPSDHPLVAARGPALEPQAPSRRAA